MATSSLRPLLSTFFSHLFLVLLHLGCLFICTTTATTTSAAAATSRQSRKRKLSPNHHENHPPPPPSRIKTTPGKAFSASWSFLKRIFTSCSSTTTPPSATTHTPPHHNPSIPSPSSSTRSLHHPIIIPLTPDPPLIRTTESSDISADPIFFPLRNDIYPCTLCGEIFSKTSLLEHHQAIKHAVSELYDEDSGKSIVQIIFKTGWPSKAKDPTVHRVLKIHNSPKILNRFEEYRECVIAKAANISTVNNKKDARCLADGNELLRFHCTTFMCDLGKNDNSSICNNQYCSACGIIRSGFSPKLDGISTLSTSWRAHVAIPEDIEEEFKFMHVKRAMLVCRVVAGRVGCDPSLPDKDDPGFDSLVGRGSGLSCRLDEEDELLVFNPRAVLPCFVIVYTV